MEFHATAYKLSKSVSEVRSAGQHRFGFLTLASPSMRLVQYVRLNPSGYVKEKNHAPDPKKLANLTFTPLGRLLVGLDAWKFDP